MDCVHFWGKIMRSRFNRLALATAAMGAATTLVAVSTSPAVAISDRYESTKGVACASTATECALALTAIPANREVTVTRLTCSVTYTGAPAFSYFQFGHRGNNTGPTALDKGAVPLIYIAPMALPSDNTLKVYAVNMEMNLIFTAGQVPYVYQALRAGKFSKFECSIFGTVVPINN
jgi:hypothetical protein